jgi:hypothetical protein
MRVVYLDFRLPWPAKIAAELLTPGKWWPFENYLTTTWTVLYFVHTYRLSQHQINQALDGQVAKLQTWMGLDLRAMARLKPSKRTIQIWLLRDFTMDSWKAGFFACSPYGFTVTRCSEINVSGKFLLVHTFLHQVLFEFLKKKMLWSIFGRTTKNWSFAQKFCHFSDFFFAKISKKLWIFDFFFVIRAHF